MPPVLQCLDKRQKLTLVGGIIAFRRIQLFGDARHQFDTPIRIRLRQSGSYRKITRIEMDDVFLRGIVKSQDSGALELKLQAGHRVPVDLSKRPDSVLLEQVREWRRDFGVGWDEPLVKPAYPKKTPHLFDICWLGPSADEGNFVRLGRNPMGNHLKAAKIDTRGRKRHFESFA